ncbi:MAG: hypothetical protein NVS3B12_29900 [Acidimicrobiales bacterium]
MPDTRATGCCGPGVVADDLVVGAAWPEKLINATSCGVPDRMRRSATTPLPVEHDHALRVADLAGHHRDPFDRLLMAQAQALGIPIITADDQFDRYDVEIVQAPG